MRITTRQFATIVVLLTSLLLSPVTLMAQASVNDWSRLNSVTGGSKLSVKLRNGKKIDGTLSSVSDSALTLMVKNTSTELKRDDVRTVHAVGGNSATKATLIGLGLGAGAGAIAGGVADASSDGFEDLDNIATGVLAVLGAGVGALGGFLVGKSMKKRVLIYEAK
jgi:small nuclear ribonucleoprotein (snRNP)-like protein